MTSSIISEAKFAFLTVNFEALKKPKYYFKVCGVFGLL